MSDFTIKAFDVYISLLSYLSRSVQDEARANARGALFGCFVPSRK